jgi:hypothetical protein
VLCYLENFAFNNLSVSPIVCCDISLCVMNYYRFFIVLIFAWLSYKLCDIFFYLCMGNSSPTVLVYVYLLTAYQNLKCLSFSLLAFCFIQWVTLCSLCFFTADGWSLETQTSGRCLFSKWLHFRFNIYLLHNAL